MILGSVPSHEMLLEIEKNLTQARIDNWLAHDLFTFQWWLLLIVLVVPWLVCWRFVDKKRLIEILLLGAIVLIISSYLDTVLSELGLWSYDYELIPLWPRLMPADFTVLPLTYMFVYQYFQDWKRFLTAMTIVSALLAFVGEQFLVLLNIYHLHGWKHVYSFPIYFVIGAFVKWLMQRMLIHNKNLININTKKED